MEIFNTISLSPYSENYIDKNIKNICNYIYNHINYKNNTNFNDNMKIINNVSHIISLYNYETIRDLYCVNYQYPDRFTSKDLDIIIKSNLYDIIAKYIIDYNNDNNTKFDKYVNDFYKEINGILQN